MNNDNWITENMLEWARNPDNIRISRELCKEIFDDYAIENKAKVIIPSWSTRKTIKQIIDDWIVDKNAEIIRRGANYYIQNPSESFCMNLGKKKTFVVEYAMMARRRYDEDLIAFSNDGELW